MTYLHILGAIPTGPSSYTVIGEVLLGQVSNGLVPMPKDHLISKFVANYVSKNGAILDKQNKEQF